MQSRRVRQGTKHRSLTRSADRLLQEPQVPLAASSVQYHPKYLQISVEVLKTLNDGGNTAGCHRSIEHQQNGKVQLLGNFSAAALFAGAGNSIEQSHHGFGHCDIGSLAAMTENFAIGLGIEHPRIQIARDAAANVRVMRRIDEIGSALESLHSQAAPSERPDQSQRQCSLAAAGCRTRHHEGLHNSVSTFPLSASGSPANIIRTLSAIRATF